MTVIPDPSVSQHLAVTDTAVVPGTPLTLQPPGVTPSTNAKPDVIGLAITTVGAGDNVAYIAYGTLELSDWTAIIGTAALTPGIYYYLGVNFFLTSTPPDIGQLVEVGRAESETVFDINIKTAMFLTSVEFVTIRDILTILDAASTIDDVIGSCSDLLAIVDAASAVDFRNFSDSLSIVDSASGVDNVIGSSSDLLTIVDVASGIDNVFGTSSDLLTIVDAASAIDVAPQFIFFENSVTSKISRATAAGGSITALDTNTQFNVPGLGVDSGNGLIMFVNINGNYNSLPLAGGTSTNRAAYSADASTLEGFNLDTVNRYIWTTGEVAGNFKITARPYNTNGTVPGSDSYPYTFSGNPGGLALDLIHSFSGFSPVLYYGDSTIFRAGVNYSGPTLVGATSIYASSAPGPLACDATNGHLFVVDGTDLYAMGLDGSSPVKIVSVGSQIFRLIVKPALQKIYVLANNALTSYNYDGSGATSILTSTNISDSNYGID